MPYDGPLEPPYTHLPCPRTGQLDIIRRPHAHLLPIAVGGVTSGSGLVVLVLLCFGLPWFADFRRPSRSLGNTFYFRKASNFLVLVFGHFCLRWVTVAVSR